MCPFILTEVIKLGIEHLELMPEPEDSRILTAVDPSAPGYPGSAYGLSDDEAKELRWPFGPMKDFVWPWGAVTFSLGAVFILISWSWIQAFLIPILPDSEWAYESSGFREMQSEGYFGEGIHVCIVDTGIDIDHPDFSDVNLRGFRDFYSGDHNQIRDVGSDYHGTLMAGLMVANGTYVGAAPEVTLSIALALGPDGGGGKSDRVANAIRWCYITQDADIISLSLGGDPGKSNTSFRSETVSAVTDALDSGVFIVAAAGNNGMDPSIIDVSVPSNLDRVISVGASMKGGSAWLNSSKGSIYDPYTGDERVFPNQKPEIMAPGIRMFSTASTSINPPYAYSTGTSDSTVLVSSGLALILEKHGDQLRGEDGQFNQSEMELVKRSLATSALTGDDTSSHHLKRGYGQLDVVAWSEQVVFELNL